MKLLMLIALTVMIAPLAQAKPTNPYLIPLKDWAFWAANGNFAASTIYDVHSTKVCEHTKPPQCAEAYKGHDSYGYVAPLIGLVGAGEYGCFLMLHDHKWWRRTVCPALAVGMSIQHWKDGSTIYHVFPVARP